MAEFVRARHPDVEGEALLPTTAFRHMPGWEPVDANAHVATAADGTVAQVLDQVGNDPVRAAAALEAEQAGKNRTTLVERLSEIANQNQES
jgi:hypothetical protein